MSYRVDIYENSFDNSSRFLLGMDGEKPLISIGLNPSTADEKKPDMTISKIIGFANRFGFDSFIMLNLYAQRATFPDNLDIKLDKIKHSQNISKITEQLKKYDEINILASWGEKIKKRGYLINCLKDINSALQNFKVNWLQIGGLTKSGHPRHPSRAAYELGFQAFNFNRYINKLSND